jgi:hypothetical protein
VVEYRLPGLRVRGRHYHHPRSHSSRRQIDAMTTAVFEHNPAARADRVRQSNLALVGLGLLIVAFLLQIIGDWPK